jgi:hypothetical protein
VKLLGKLPNPDKDDGGARNGLSTQEVRERVLEDPSRRLLAVVELHVSRLTTHVDEGGWREPAMVVHRIEPCLLDADEDLAEQLLDGLAERRTGRQPALFAVERAASRELDDDEDAAEDGDLDEVRALYGALGQPVGTRDGIQP